MFASLKQLEEGETFLTQSRYEVAQDHHASHKLLDVFYTGRPLHTSNGRDFFGVCLNASSADDVAQEDDGSNTEYTLGGIQFPSVFFKGFERLLKVSDEVIGGLGLTTMSSL